MTNSKRALLHTAGMTALAAAAFTAASARSLAVQAPAATASLTRGAYTAAQQKRGAAIYNRECSTCHGERLEGGEGSPPLAGAAFQASYGGQPVAMLFDKIRTTMPAPPELPGKLTPAENADVVAHILSVNGFPAGDTALPADAEALKRLVIPRP